MLHTNPRKIKKDVTQLEKLFVFLTFITALMLLSVSSYYDIQQNNPSTEKNLFPNTYKNHLLTMKHEAVRDDDLHKNITSGKTKQMERIPEEDSINKFKRPFLLHYQTKEQNNTTLKNLQNENNSRNKTVSGLHGEEANKSACLPIWKHPIPKVDLEDCSSPHVIIHDGGMLGNKLCQYISLFLLRHIYGIRVSITEKMKKMLGQLFKNISLPVQDFVCFPKKTTRIMYDALYNTLYSKALETFHGSRDPLNPHFLDESYYIYHHPCPRELITEFRNLTRKVLSFQDHIVEKAKKNIIKALAYINRTWQNSTLITVHVRQRDYTKYLMKHYNMSQLNEVYFHRAFDYYRNKVKNPVFVVVSDNHSWCRKFLQSKDVIVAGSKKNPLIDMIVLSLGDHHIISYGTFSFMGAMLGHGTIVHPVNENKLYNHYNCVNDQIFIPMSRDAKNVNQTKSK